MTAVSDEPATGDGPASSDGSASGERPTAVFRVAPLSLLGAAVITVCVTPFAFAQAWFWLVYLVPLAMVGFVLRVRTTVDVDGLTVRRLVGHRRVRWDGISSLRLDRRRIRAVLADGAELPLPSVGIRDLPQLAAASGGHLTLGDP